MRGVGRARLAVLAAVAAAGAAGAQEPPIQASWDEEGSAIVVTFHEAAVLQGTAPWREAFHLVRVGDGSQEEIPLDTEALADDMLASGEDLGLDVPAGFLGLQTLFVDLVRPVDPAGEYALAVDGGVFRILREGELVAWDGGRVPVGEDDTVADLTELVGSLDQARDDQGFSILAGDEQGALSFHFARRLAKLGGGLLHFDAMVRGDVVLDETERFDYFNRITARVQGFRSFRYDLLGRESYGEAGLHYELDSDQKLENADHVVGAHLATVLGDPLSKALARLLTPEGYASNVPLWVLEANWVEEALEESETGAPSKPDTENGTFRLEGSLDWRVPLGRELDWNLLPGMGPVQKLDLVVEANAVWDSELDELFDDSRLVLRFSPASAPDGTRTAFEVAWARGEASPVFEDFSALLVGLRVGN